MENELYFVKEVKIWGNSLIIKFSSDEIKILNLEHGDLLEGRVIIMKRAKDVQAEIQTEKQLLPQTLEMLKEEGIDESELNESEGDIYIKEIEDDYDPDKEEIERESND